MQVSVICACFPGMRRIVKIFWPKLMGATNLGTRRTAITKDTSHVATIGSGNEKKPKLQSLVSIRSKGSDDNDFIPLHDLEPGTSSTHSSRPDYAGSIDSQVHLQMPEKGHYSPPSAM
jgi:hypothetical protein